MNAYKVLSVDFDFFFKENPAWDWSYSEHDPAPIQTVLWTVWAFGFKAAGKRLPGLTHNPVTALRPSALRIDRLFTTNSHARIREAFPYIKTEAGTRPVEVTSLDAHHDAGYGSMDKDCADWTLCAREEFGSPVQVIYPPWRRLAGYAEEPPDSEEGRSAVTLQTLHRMGELPKAVQGCYGVVFLCLSSAWVPSWLHSKFVALAIYLKSLATTTINLETDV